MNLKIRLYVGVVMLKFGEMRLCKCVCVER